MSKDNRFVFENALGGLASKKEALDAIRAALVEGEQSGAPLTFDFDDYVAAKRAPTRTGTLTP